MQIQFLQNVGAVRLDGVDAEIENRGRLFVGFALGEQLQDFAFAAGEQLVGGRTGNSGKLQTGILKQRRKPLLRQ